MIIIWKYGEGLHGLQNKLRQLQFTFKTAAQYSQKTYKLLKHETRIAFSVFFSICVQQKPFLMCTK